MATLQSFYLVEDAENIGIYEEAGINADASEIVIQPTGTATGYTVVIEGALKQNNMFVPLTLLDTNGFDLLTEITDNGIYVIGASGIGRIRANITSHGGGRLDLHCKTIG